MQLNQWIENKIKELLDNKAFKSVTFRDVDTCTVSSYMTGRIFYFGASKPQINMDINIEEFNRKELTGEIDALEVSFNVVKPRCRKSERFSLFVREVQ